MTVDETGDALLELAIPAQLLDGADIGSPGWILARTLGTEDGAILRWAPTENTRHGHLPTMNVDDVAAHLAHELNTACHISNDPHIPSGAPKHTSKGSVSPSVPEQSLEPSSPLRGRSLPQPHTPQSGSPTRAQQVLLPAQTLPPTLKTSSQQAASLLSLPSNGKDKPGE